MYSEIISKELQSTREQLKRCKNLRKESYNMMNGDLSKISALDYLGAKHNYEFADKMVIEYMTRLDEVLALKDLFDKEKENEQC